jgi:lipoprotein-releasing system ATP-binding protein
METPILEARSISKTFTDPVEVKVLKNVSMHVLPGEFVSIVGKSGCGKSTLLYILSTMDTDYEGALFLKGKALSGEKPEFLANMRNAHIGFVFQFHYLLPEFSVLHNVMLPGLKQGNRPEVQVESEAMAHLRRLGMADKALKKANQLSGGEKQRVAIARALINHPDIIMGDEPTGNLDKKNADLVFGIFKELAEERQQSLLVVTHDTDFAQRTDRTIVMEDGEVISQG